jgi:predicted signal transduction protein with EAL and GGDEF domain
MLKELGCPQGQGYHFARPVPAAQLTNLLEVGKLPLSVPAGSRGAGNGTHKEAQYTSQ